MGEYPYGNSVTLYETFTVDGVPTDPTTVTFELRNPLGVLVEFAFGPDTEVTNPSVGYYECSFIPSMAGDWLYEAVATGTVTARSATGTFTVDDSGVSPTTSPPARTEPCAPWIDGQDLAQFCAAAETVVGSDFSTLEPYCEQATDLLFELSGRRYLGLCPALVRPCGSGCFGLGGMQVLSRGHVAWSGWGWQRDRQPFCGCSPVSTVTLPGYPVRRIVEVKIDGDVVDPAGYELRDWRFLVRLNDSDGNAQVWPACQDMGAPAGDDGTFMVSYMHGSPVPSSGVAAAQQLACELWKRANNDPTCALPDGVTRVTRQGVTFERPAFISWAHQGGQSRSLVYGWHTGLGLVDAFLNAKNPSGLKRRPTVMSPDFERYPQRAT